MRDKRGREGRGGRDEGKREGGRAGGIYHITMHSQSTNTMTPWQLARILHTVHRFVVTSQARHIIYWLTRLDLYVVMQSFRQLYRYFASTSFSVATTHLAALFVFHVHVYIYV